MVKQYIAVFIRFFFDILSFAIIARVLLSWTNINRSHPVHQFLDDVTKPVLKMFSKITPKTGMIDLTPLIAMLGLDVIKIMLLYLLSF